MEENEHMPNDRKELKYEIITNVGIVSEQPGGWKKELNRVSWNGGEPKYDLRDWAPEHAKMGKGITMTEEDLRSLKKIIDAEIGYLDSET